MATPIRRYLERGRGPAECVAANSDQARIQAHIFSETTYGSYTFKVAQTEGKGVYTMSDQYVGEIRMFAGARGMRVPVGWAFCDGAVLPIQSNEALFTLIGTQYGGDGINNFALPDLRSRLPIHNGTLTPGGSTYNLANSGGSETVQLTQANLPVHTHKMNIINSVGTTPTPGNTVYPATSTVEMYGLSTSPTPTLAAMDTQSVSIAGGSLPHDNMMPYLTIAFIIALQGIFPSPA